jgi:cell wall-associated NlpC family hydrolase
LHKFAKKITLRNFISLFILFLVFTSCKTTSVIVTSKSEAEKQGLYKKPEVTIKTKPEKKKKKVVEKVDPIITEISPIKDIKSRLSTDENSDDLIINTSDSSYLVEQLINAASENLGARYRSGGSNPEGFDCSGLMFYTFSKFDLILPRSSNQMSKLGSVLNPNEIRKGDLIFFKTNGRKIINHVGMVVEVLEDEIKFIHSATSKGVIISSTKEPYYKRTFAQVNRIYSSF